jgi:hypothetical protein
MLPSKWPVFIRSFLAGFDRSLTLTQAREDFHLAPSAFSRVFRVFRG